MFDGQAPNTGEDDPSEAVQRCLWDAIGSAQRLGLQEITGTLLGIYAMRHMSPAVLLPLLQAMRTQANDFNVLGERVRRAIALLEQRERGAGAA